MIMHAMRPVDTEHSNKFMQHLRYPYDFPFVNFANNFQYLKYLEKFKMVIKGHKTESTVKFFTPFQIQVEAQLIHGCEVLAESKTTPIPFNYAPRFN